MDNVPGRSWWGDDPRERELLLVGTELHGMPLVHIDLGPIKTDTHVLGSYGWRLHMRQSTPVHVTRTRPRVTLSPDGGMNYGIRFRFRAREPYDSPDEVFRDMAESKASRFSLTRFETKYLPIRDERMADELTRAQMTIREFIERLSDKEAQVDRLSRELLMESQRWRTDHDESEEIGRLRARVAELESRDPFQLLSEWSDGRIGGLDFSRRRVFDLSNVIELADHIVPHDPVELDRDTVERLNRALA